MAPPLASPCRPGSGSLPTLALAAAVVTVDQLSKEWVLGHLPLEVAQPFLPGLLDLQYVRNTGAAFSLLSGNPHLLGLVSMVVSAGLVIWILLRPCQAPWRNLALACLLGGAAGNGIDRFRHGAVTDFLALVPISFPVFNLADVAINLAVAFFLLDALLPAASGFRKGGPRPRRPGGDG